VTDLDAALAPWRERWQLDPDGEAFTTPSSVLQLVRRGGEPRFLKVATAEEERAGGTVIAWWSGEGAAAVVEADADAVLLERATGARDLGQLSRSGAAGDDEATRILCRAGRRLHAAGTGPRPDGLFDLRRWFRDLLQRGDAAGDDLFVVAARVAEELLRHPDRDVVLHGDLHHGNVLDFGERGWLAIDPKGLLGEAAFDACNVLTNPSHERALAPGRLERQFAVVLATTGVPPERMARWFVAWCALSSTWFALDDDPGLAESAAALGERALGLVSS
jgi:streptomycin 6-kinase